MLRIYYESHDKQKLKYMSNLFLTRDFLKTRGGENLNPNLLIPVSTKLYDILKLNILSEFSFDSPLGTITIINIY